MRQQPTRQDLVAEHGLQLAPRAWQREFWQRYNRRARREPLPVGELAGRVLSPAFLAEQRRLDAVRRAWAAVVPEALHRDTWVSGFRGGRLAVTVASASTRFMLGREMKAALRDALNEALSEGRIKEIDFRIGTAAWDAAPPRGVPRR